MSTVYEQGYEVGSQWTDALCDDILLAELLIAYQENTKIFVDLELHNYWQGVYDALLDWCRINRPAIAVAHLL